MFPLPAATLASLLAMDRAAVCDACWMRMVVTAAATGLPAALDGIRDDLRGLRVPTDTLRSHGALPLSDYDGAPAASRIRAALAASPPSAASLPLAAFAADNVAARL